MPTELKPLNFLGGVNLFHHRRRIADNEARRLKNLVPTEAGILDRRGVLAWSRDVIVGSAHPHILGALSPPFTTGYEQAFYYFEEPDADYPNGSFWLFASGPMGPPLFFNHYLPPQFEHRVVMVPFGDHVYVFPGTQFTDPNFSDAFWPFNMAVIHTSAPGDFAVIFDEMFSGSNNEGIIVRCAATYRQRMVYALSNHGLRDVLIWSDRGNPKSIGDDAMTSRFTRLPGMAGDHIVGMIEVMRTGIGQQDESSLLVLGRDHAYVVTGETEESTYTGVDYIGSAQPLQVNEICGCASNETLVRTPYGVLWAGPDDVWGFDGGSVPRRLGTKIRPVLANTPAEYQYRWHAAYHNGFYRLAIFSDDQEPGHTNPLGEQWWLDLRNGMPRHWSEARWFGPMKFSIPREYNDNQTFGTYFMFPEQRPGHDAALYETDGLDVYAYDQQGDEDQRHDPNSIDNTLLGGTNVDWEIVSKEDDNQDGMHDKIHMGVEIDIWNSDKLHLGAEFIIDNGNLTGSHEADIPLVSPDRQRFQSLVLEPEGRLTGKTNQIRIYGKSGYIVDDSNDTVQVAISGDPEVFEIRLDKGYYEDLLAFLNHLVEKMNEAMGVVGVTFSHNQNPPAAAYTAITCNVDWTYICQSESSINVWSSLGFDTSITVPPDALTHTAVLPAVWKRSPRVSIAGIVSRIYHFLDRPRRPRGGGDEE